MMRTHVPKAGRLGLVLAFIVGLSACGGSSTSSTGTGGTGTKLSPEVWVKCADEGGTCTFSGTTQVRYGLNGAFFTRTATGSIGCNNEVFGDPLPGADKVCEYVTITSEPPPTEPPPSEPPPPSGATWTRCASEWQTCSFSGTRQVRYGLNSTWAYRTATGSIACNNSIFGDPLPGADKVCEVETTASEPPPPPPPPPPTSTTWTKCADEHQTCSFSGTHQVRYGLNGTWAYQTATGSIGCNNAVFGDPLPGVQKICEYDGSSTTPPPSSTDCNAIVDQCFDLTAAQVTRYRGDKTAAASYTFDDGYPSSSSIATIFESRGLRATFFIIPGVVGDWNFWKGLLNRGHEIGNHSMTHDVDMGDPSVSDQTLDREINGAQDMIEQGIGMRPLTFAFPWHSYTTKALQLAETRHIAVRKVNNGEANYEFAFFDRDHAGSLAEQLATVNGQLQNVVNNGGWFVAGGHGVDGDGWSPVTSQFLVDHLNFASQFTSRLWIDTYQNVARYRLCRPQVTVTASAASSSHATVRLGGGFDGGLCTAPLTVALPVKATLNGSVTVRGPDGTSIPVTRTASKVFFDVRPGETVTVDVAP